MTMRHRRSATSRERQTLAPHAKSVTESLWQTSHRCETASMECRASIMASATPAAAAPRHSTSALEARSLRGLRRDAERCQGAETVSEAYDRPPRFSHGRSDGRIQALVHCHIGGGAYFVWALPPMVGGTAQRHVPVQSHTTSSITPSKQLLLQ